MTRSMLLHLQVIHALVLRETRTRFGKHRLGYLWALIEPLLWVGTFALMFHLVDRTAPFGMAIVQFLTTGIIPFLLFSHTCTQSVHAINANKGLLYYPQVRPLDLVIARNVLEFATMVVVFALIMGGVALVLNPIVIDDLLLTILGLGLAAGLGGSMGLTLCSLSVFFPAVERLQSLVVIRPVFWTCGIFFTANDLPTPVRDVLLLNPVLHAVELIRDGWFRSYRAVHADAGYPLMWIVVLTFLGLTLERVARRRIEMA